MHQFTRKIATKKSQRGLGLIGMIFVGGLLAITGVVIAQLIPTVIEYQSIIKACNTAKGELTVADVRRAFDRNAATGYFDAISGKDLIVTKVGDKHVVSFAYNKEIHLAGPAYILMKYAGSSN